MRKMFLTLISIALMLFSGYAFADGDVTLPAKQIRPGCSVVIHKEYPPGVDPNVSSAMFDQQLLWKCDGAEAVMIGTIEAEGGGPDTDAPTSVHLSNGRELQQAGAQIVEVEASRHRTSALQLPAAFRRAVASASSIAFPAGQTTMINGQEFAMVVVNQSSTDNPTGYCGAGEEGTLYVLRLNGDRAELAYSVLVQSCIENIDLFTDSGNKSPYLAITWMADGDGFQIHWSNYTRPAPLTRQYRYTSGTFVANQ